MRRAQQRPAWAVHSQSPEGHGYIGVGYLVIQWNTDIPVQCAGNRTALFRTRREAREAQKLIKAKGKEWGFKKARVYRVMVTIIGSPA